MIDVPDEALVLMVAPLDKVMPEEPRARTVLAAIGASRVSWPLGACSVTGPAARRAPGVSEPLTWVMDKLEKSPSIVPPLRLKLWVTCRSPLPLMEPELKSSALTVAVPLACKLPPFCLKLSTFKDKIFSKIPPSLFIAGATIWASLILELVAILIGPLAVAVPPLRLRLAADASEVAPEPLRSISAFRLRFRAALVLLILELRTMLLWALRVREALPPAVLLMGELTVILPA